MSGNRFRYEWLAVAAAILLLVGIAVVPFRVRIEPASAAAVDSGSHEARATSEFTVAQTAASRAGEVAVAVNATRVAEKAALAAASAAVKAQATTEAADTAMAEMNHENAPAPDAAQAVAAEQGVVEYTLRTQLGGDPAMAYVGVGGAIEGVANPELDAKLGDLVRITIVNGDPMLHDFRIDEFGVAARELTQDGEKAIVEFVADKAGSFTYYCNIPGHKVVGMTGTLVVEGEAVAISDTSAGVHDMAALTAEVAPVEPADPNAVSIIRNPTDVPPPVGDRAPMTVTFDLETVEVSGILADGSTYHYMTFGGQVPGPMLRVREGDTVVLTLHNAITSTLAHSIDLHAVTGPGGGAVNTQTLPGEEHAFSFKALQPGLYVYHCATASVAHHISSGMYGMILVEPEGGLPPVDHEFYVMQGEMYTEQPFGTAGSLTFNYDAMLHEQPEYFVFNGAAGALTQDENALRGEVGDSVRIFFGVGGPNFISSFHVIGEIFERVFDQASLTAPPLTDVQTTMVPPGGATMVEFHVEVPGRYILVDHALSRMERGLAGYLYVEGDENPDIYHSDSEASMAGH